MRKRFSVAVVLVALVLPGVALAEPPAEVYSDFAEDGNLSCGHSRAALEAVLRDASIHQYGDPYTLLGLKLAVRKQLAGGCHRGDPAGTLAPSGDTSPPGTVDDQGSGASAKPSPPTTNKPKAEVDESASQTEDSIVLGGTGDAQEGHMVLLGVGLLLLALGSGGWAAKRAYSDRG